MKWEDIPMESFLGEFIITQEDINSFCLMPVIMDENPFHLRWGNSPLNLTTAIVAGYLWRWNVENKGEKLRLPAIKEQYAKVGAVPIKKDKTYQIFFGCDPVDAHHTTIHFVIYPMDLPRSSGNELIYGYITIAHRSQH